MLKQWLRAAGTAAVLAMVAVSAQANEALFAPIDADSYGKALNLDPSFQSLAEEPSTGYLHLVRANPAALSEKTAALTLDLAPGVQVRAHQVDSYFTKDNMLVWSGVIEDPGAVTIPFSPEELRFDPINSVTMVKNGELITGNVHVGGEWYQIRPLKSGGHAIVTTDLSAMPADHPEEFNRTPVRRMPARPANEKADTVITVQVNYTPNAASSSGDINGLITLAVAESNQGYTNSGVLIDLVEVTRSQVSYTESSNFSTNLSRYRNTSDGYMDNIHSLRNTYAADVNVLIIRNTAACGQAYSIGSTAANAFAIVHWSCATGYYSFAHEIGHLQSARHDPATDPSTSPYPYGHGYRYTGSPDWRTIMAYDCPGGCPRLNYWSNPLKTYNGVPMGTSSQSDNTRVLNNTRGTIAAFR